MEEKKFSKGNRALVKSNSGIREYYRGATGTVLYYTLDTVLSVKLDGVEYSVQFDESDLTRIYDNTTIY